MNDLPGTNKDWNDEADSVEVGSAATVTILTEEDFQGVSSTLEAGSKHSDVDEPSSIELICN